MMSLVDRIRARGHWDASIAPSEFEPSRLAFDELIKVAHRAQVRMRGWPVPFIPNEGLDLGQDWVGNAIDGGVTSHHEIWRLFQTGQFAQLRMISQDRHTTLEDAAKFPRVIEVWEILFYLTEVFELAARLAAVSGMGDAFRINIELHGMRDRHLVPGSNRTLFEDYVTKASVMRFSETVSAGRLLADAPGLALQVTADFLARFGATSIGLDALADHQQELLR